MNTRKSLTLIEIENLMLRTLAYKGSDIDTEGKNFPMYGYQWTEGDLLSLFESLAMKDKLIGSDISIGARAWGVPRRMLHSNYSTNFNDEEIKKIYETFYKLLNRGVIAPGAVGNFGSNLPNFHVTEYGLMCLEKIDILPYDSEGYLRKLEEVDSIDEWVIYYMRQALECYNLGCYDAALLMIGLASEFVVEKLIENYTSYLKIKHKNKIDKFEKDILNCRSISTKYSTYTKSFSDIKGSDIGLNNLAKKLDILATDTFMSHIRLTRNELIHPSEVKTDKITVLMIFISLIHYCERYYRFINYYKSII